MEVHVFCYYETVRKVGFIKKDDGKEKQQQDLLYIQS